MVLNDIMTAPIIVVGPSETLANAAKKMRDADVGVLPVYDGERTVGIITDRDIVIRAVAQGADIASQHVSEFMTGDVVACPGGYDIHEAAQIMEHRQIRRLVIVDSEHRPIGVVSLKDLSLTRDTHLQCQVLKEVTKDKMCKQA